MFANIRIKSHEYGLLFRHGEFKAILGPGAHLSWSRFFGLDSKVETYSTLETAFQHSLLDILVKDPRLSAVLHVVELGDKERALVWRDNRLAFLLGPGRHAFWREPFELTFERFHVDNLRLEHSDLEAILAHSGSEKWLEVVNVAVGEQVLFFRDGILVEALSAGRHVFWKGSGYLSWRLFDLREQTINVAGQEIMTRDKVTLRVNLIVTFKVSDVFKAVEVVADSVQSLYKEAQMVLRAVIGTRTLDALLDDKEVVGSEVRDALSRRAGEFGVDVRSVGVKDIILPGDMKAIMNQVIAAEKLAQADLIRRREETAAARSQANTARLLAENPALVRMKELEAIKEILAGSNATFVFGEGDIARRIRGLLGSREPAGKGG